MSEAEEGPVASHDEVAEKLQSARALWRERGQPNYSFEVRRSNPLMVQPRVRLTVLDGKPTQVILVPFEEPLPPGISAQPTLSQRDSLPESWPTVDELFAILDSAVREAIRVEAEFDPQYGYPTRIFVDPTRAVDDELFITARALFPIS